MFFFFFFYRSHSVLLEKIIHTEQGFYTLLWVSMNARFLFRPSISKGAGGGGEVLANRLVQNSRAQAPCFIVFTCRVSLSDSLESEASLRSSR